jgi:hypothetical protein
MRYFVLMLALVFGGLIFMSGLWRHHKHKSTVADDLKSLQHENDLEPQKSLTYALTQVAQAQEKVQPKADAVVPTPAAPPDAKQPWQRKFINTQGAATPAFLEKINQNPNQALDELRDKLHGPTPQLHDLQRILNYLPYFQEMDSEVSSLALDLIEQLRRSDKDVMDSSEKANLETKALATVFERSSSGPQALETAKKLISESNEEQERKLVVESLILTHPEYHDELDTFLNDQNSKNR